MTTIVIRLFPKEGVPYSQTLKVNPDEFDQYRSAEDYVQEVHSPPHHWEFTF